MTTILTLIACITAIAAYSIYYIDIKQSNLVPSRYSWIIWSLSISLETITFVQVSDDGIKSLYFIISSLCCIFITIRIWFSASWRGPNRAEKFSILFYALFLLLWPFIKVPFFAHGLLVLAIPVTFIPTYKSTLSNFRYENSLAWLLWSISDLIVVIIIFQRMKTITELPYAIVEFACHFSVAAIIIYRQFPVYKRLFEGKLNIPGKI